MIKPKIIPEQSGMPDLRQDVSWKSIAGAIGREYLRRFLAVWPDGVVSRIFRTFFDGFNRCKINLAQA